MMGNPLKILDNQQKDKHIFKLAIEPPQHIAPTPKLHEWDVRQPLEDIINELAVHYNIPRPQEYGIKFGDNVNNFYITEKTKRDVKDGIILKLTTAPWKEAKEVYSALKSASAGHRNEALAKLSVSAKDATFGAEFVKLEGVEYLMSRVEEGKEKGQELCCLLTGVQALMKNKQIPSTTLTPAVLKKIAFFVGPANAKVTQVALAILESVVMNCPDHYVTVTNEVTLSSLRPYLDNPDDGVRQECLGLINALCLKATAEKKKRFEESIASRELRVVIHEKVVRAALISNEMAHNLYVFQQLYLNLLQHKRMMKVDQNDELHQEMILNLRKNAFAADAENKRPMMHTDDFKKLGFTDPSDPAKDFEATPPGVLGLQCWSHLSNQHTENYTQMVHDNLGRGEEYQCPFAQACISLTEALCNILNIGDEPDTVSTSYHPMFFAMEDSFEEFFCHCIKLFHKTWKEMKACHVDFPKVMSVVKEQITEALALKPASMDSFWQQVQTRFAYANIKELRKLRRVSLDDNNSQAPSVLDLKQQLTADVMELIKQQRLNFMVKGGKLSNRSMKGKPTQYFQLSRNHKVLHYGDYRDSTSIPSIETLKEKIQVIDIAEVAAGKYQTTGNRPHHKHLFTISMINNTKIELSSETFEGMEMWIDGFDILLGREMSSNKAKSDLEYLLGIEVSIHLLDTANLVIPHIAPVVPEPPEDFNFCTD
ncbi:engulfment and cell motility protein 1-like isoform X2 [Apostichopus japonicus]|uniref:engulfment and cell motility protein 1-like isoform X2 n=1 Tax=Stichopus japonicus TaxID=307972 RepID=UPI003AB46429